MYGKGSPTLPVDTFFDDHFWTSNFRKFVVLAHKRIQRRSWRGAFNGLPAGGIDARDCVVEAAQLLMSGRRRCPAHLSREMCVYGVIESLISHAADAPENRAHHRFLSTDPADEDNAAIDESLVTADTASIEETIAAREFIEEFKAVFSDERYHRFLDALASGECESAQDVAQRLDIDEAGVRAMTKVVRRARDQWPGNPRKESDH